MGTAKAHMSFVSPMGKHGQGHDAYGAPTPETGCTVQRRENPLSTLKNRTACMADLLRYSSVTPTTDVRSATRFRLTTFTDCRGVIRNAT
jgi:hypothetical protein